ncbi:D-amino-acid oxidase [Handroanthus impetiginosus]|uniref:D-amino-acid oxidase n=1 Tax=Handroanthus impetiginosus TaxID=429701 RepID=A0A2G9H1G7_9LAMI|nr:D-amino-acid oxidase [Handroanthus impetiginosus]
MFTQNPAFISWKWQKTRTSLSSTHRNSSYSSSSSFSLRCFFSSSSSSSSSSVSRRPLRYAVLGAGFAGLSVAWNLLQHGSKESHLCVDIYDEVGVGGGASGVAGGLLHPYSPKVKLLWHGAEFWKESLNLLNVAEGALLKLANEGKCETLGNVESPIVRRRGILRPVVNLKNMRIMTENAQNCLTSCRIEPIHEDAARNLIPNISVPLNLAFYMPEALNINAQSYLQGLYLACENLANDISNMGYVRRELSFHKKSIQSLQELAGEYDAVIICFGTRAGFLPELSGKLPLRTCRGVIAHLQLCDDMREEYPEHSPSILSDAWLAVHGARNIDLGSTWDWSSRNYSRDVTREEASEAMEVLLPKASSVYPAIKNWNITGAVAGLRAMPPITADGSLPLLGCVDEYIDGGHKCKYWLFAGLGARGLLFHGWLGKLLAFAVLSCDENLLPSELTSWKHKMNR